MAKGGFPFAKKAAKGSKPNPFAKTPKGAPAEMPFKKGGKVGRK